MLLIKVYSVYLDGLLKAVFFSAGVDLFIGAVFTDILAYADDSSGSYSSGYARGRGTYTAGTVNAVPLITLARKSVIFLCHFLWPDVDLFPKI